MNSKPKFGIAHLVNVCVAVIVTAQTLGKTLADGFQPFTDTVALFGVVPNVMEVINDGKQAVAELMDLDAAESADVAAQIALRTGNPSEGILAKVNEGLHLLARGHQQVSDGLELFADCKAFTQSLA